MLRDSANSGEPLPSNRADDQATSQDIRIYVPHAEGWQARVKQNSLKEYCYYKSPGDDHFHLLMTGEVHLVKGDEKCCLNCAARLGVTTTNRLHWQQPSRRTQSPRF